MFNTKFKWEFCEYHKHCFNFIFSVTIFVFPSVYLCNVTVLVSSQTLPRVRLLWFFALSLIFSFALTHSIHYRDLINNDTESISRQVQWSYPFAPSYIFSKLVQTKIIVYVCVCQRETDCYKAYELIITTSRYTRFGINWSVCIQVPSESCDLIHNPSIVKDLCNWRCKFVCYLWLYNHVASYILSSVKFASDMTLFLRNDDFYFNHMFVDECVENVARLNARM